MDCAENIGKGLRNPPIYIRNLRNNIDKYIDFIYDNISMKYSLEQL